MMQRWLIALRRYRLGLIGLVLLIASSAWLLRRDPTVVESETHWTSSDVVSVDWLHQQMESSGAKNAFIVVEASWAELKDADDYLDGHIPGAIHVNTDLLETGYPEWKVKDIDSLHQQLGQLGIGSHSTVVVYSRQLIAAARVWWIFRYAGVRDVRILNGDMRTWRAHGYAVQREVRTLNPVLFAGTARTDWLATTKDVEQMVSDHSAILLDVRSRAEYLGETSGYSYLDAKGRIPGAYWLGDADDGSHIYKQRNGMLRSPEQVLAEWRRHGWPPVSHTRGAVPNDDLNDSCDQPLVFYCGGGWRSSVAMLYARALGFGQVRNYSDGWSGWSTDYRPAELGSNRSESSNRPDDWQQVPSGRRRETGRETRD
ncbi:MAG: sulfurtransferase [Planctomycetales bacterium]|nr:sulfurtransferase [Planctomycetales bacterium]